LHPMLKPTHLTTLSREELLALVAELQRQDAALRAEIDELMRGGKRQAVPATSGSSSRRCCRRCWRGGTRTTTGR
jgi:hypothetical protein